VLHVRQPLGGMAEAGLASFYRRHRWHRDQAFGLPRRVDGLALAHQLPILKTRHRDAAAVIAWMAYV
jgi:hypothetical protein